MVGFSMEVSTSEDEKALRKIIGALKR